MLARGPSLAVVIAGAGLVAAMLAAPVAIGAEAGSAEAAATATAAAAQDRARLDDLLACSSAPQGQDRAACLKEAAAARSAASQGKLVDDPGQYRRNAIERCKVLPPEDRPDCEARVLGAGTTQGSVEEGGILRESVTRELAAPVVAPAPGTPPAKPALSVTPMITSTPSVAPPAMAPMPSGSPLDFAPMAPAAPADSPLELVPMLPATEPAAGPSGNAPPPPAPSE